MVPVVALIGRPNVGKSALFNRLLQKRQALVDATPGLTRDRLYGDLSWRGVPFRIVDTGGLQFARENRISEAIASQVSRAMQEAALALLVVDVHDGPVPLDAQVAEWARRWGKPVMLVVNKVDDPKRSPSVYEFSSLGLDPAYPVSSMHGLGIGDLLDAVVEALRASGARLSAGEAAENGPAGLTIALVGRPNVGKSSFMNRVLDEPRVLVDEVPGTTRDPVGALVPHRGAAVRLIDTAGMRSARKLKNRMDAVARLKALEVVRGSDVCLALIDGSVGLVQDDLKLLDQVMSSGKPICVAVNKWDLVKGAPDARRVSDRIAQRAPFLRDAPVICISAKTGLNVFKAIDLAAETAARGRRRITVSDGKRLVEKVRADRNAPVAVRTSTLIRLAQVGVSPPTFHLLARLHGEDALHGFKPSDMAYLEGVVTREFGFTGVPIRLHVLSMGREEKKRRSKRR